MKALRTILLVVLSAAIGGVAGFAIRERGAQQELTTMSPSHHLSNVGTEQFVLVMLEQNRAAQLISVMERRLADNLHLVRLQLSVVSPDVYRTWPNLIESARRSGEYFSRVQSPPGSGRRWPGHCRAHVPSAFRVERSEEALRTTALPNMPLQPTVTRPPGVSTRRAGSRQRLNAGR